VHGCWNRRFNHQLSRGLIRRIAEARTPRSRSHTQASNAVLPAPIDERDRRVGMRAQRVGKRHPRGSGTDYEIVRFEFFVHDLAMTVVASPNLRVLPFDWISHGRGMRSASRPRE
jgi:hypothetical protein